MEKEVHLVPAREGRDRQREIGRKVHVDPARDPRGLRVAEGFRVVVAAPQILVEIGVRPLDEARRLLLEIDEGRDRADAHAAAVEVVAHRPLLLVDARLVAIARLGEEARPGEEPVPSGRS